MEWVSRCIRDTDVAVWTYPCPMRVGTSMINGLQAAGQLTLQIETELGVIVGEAIGELSLLEMMIGSQLIGSGSVRAAVARSASQLDGYCNTTHGDLLCLAINNSSERIRTKQPLHQHSYC